MSNFNEKQIETLKEFQELSTELSCRITSIRIYTALAQLDEKELEAIKHLIEIAKA